MARLKSYYTTDEITNDLYTFGKEFMTIDNVEYIGPYHRYITGEVYTEFQWNPKISQRLQAYTDLSKSSQLYKTLSNIQIPTQYPIQVPCVINKNNMMQGFVTRYFINKNNENIITEINLQQYNDWRAGQIDRVLYTAIQLDWTITGTLQDTVKNGITIPGVISKNRKAIADVYTQIPQLNTYLTNLAEYYTDADFVIPKDINNLES